MIPICKIKYGSTSWHNKICSGMNATDNYLFKYLISKVLFLYENQGVTRNNLNSYRRRRNYMNRWHLLHHVLRLEELATSSPKSRGTCRIYMWWRFSCVVARFQLVRTWQFGQYTLLCVGWPLLYCLSFETWQLPKGREREGGREWMSTFVWRTTTKFCRQKIAPKHSRYDHCSDPQYQWVGGEVTMSIATDDQRNI
jgi:hypothetical protein